MLFVALDIYKYLCFRESDLALCSWNEW